MISKSQLKYIQSLGQKKHRDEAGVFLAEGPKLVSELLRNKNVGLINLYAVEEWIGENPELLLNRNLVAISQTELERISQLKTPNKVLGIFARMQASDPDVNKKISLVLDGIRDPGNMGTIVRIADWFNVSHIICSQDCADVYNPKTVQATMGSIARVSIFQTELAKWLARQTVRIYAGLLEGRNVAEMGPINEGLIVIGNESKGIDDEILALAHEKITISKLGHAESLNAAVATGIILSHLV